MGSSDLFKVTWYLFGLWSLTIALPTNGSYRLPLEVIPISYSIHLVPYLDEGDSSRQFTFDGNVSILVRAERPETSITLHASDMDIRGLPTVSEMNSGEIINVTNVTTDNVREFLVLHLATPLTAKDFYRLNLSYKGNLQTEHMGFFKNSYKINRTSRRWLAATKFESQGARRAFPCFDEPALRATFNISIARLPHMSSISNMPLQTTIGPDPSLNGRYWDIFQPSVRMSTYLVSFVVSDYKALESGMYRVWSKPSTVEQGKFALSITPQVVSVMENFTGIPYSLPKVDQVAIPGYRGATENWGIIIYGEDLLLTSSTSYNVARLIAHELTHQWFGNLVTINWWKYTWLKEGFANFLQYFILSKVFPHSIDAYILTEKEQFRTMDEDSKVTSRPKSADVERSEEIALVYDVITYSKGACVLKMMAHSLTFRTFCKGVNVYLQAKAYSDAVADDLFAGLQKAVDEDGVLPEGVTVKAIMDTWTLQSGYPVITVTRNYTTGTATVHQAQRLPDSNATSSNSSWFVPLTYTTSKELEFNITKPSLWLSPHANATIENLPEQDQWIIFNIQAMGFFRVNYDALNWKLLIDQLNTDKNKIHPMNRLQLLEDSLYLFQAGLLDFNTAMDVNSYLSKETDPSPWMSGFRNLQKFYSKIGGSPFFPALQSYYLKMMGPLYEAVGFESQEESSVTLNNVRSELLHWACLLGHEDCMSYSARSVVRMRSCSTHRSDRKVKRAVYCATVRREGESSWKWMWNVYMKAEDVEERQDALHALGCTSDVRILKRLLILSVTEDSGLKRQDRMNVFSAACNGRDSVSCDTTLKFIEFHFHQIGNMFGEYQTISLILSRIASRLRTQEQVDTLKFIINKNKDSLSADEHLLSCVKKMAQGNVDWFKTKGADIINWLSQHQPT